MIPSVLISIEIDGEVMEKLWRGYGEVRERLGRVYEVLYETGIYL